MIQPEGEGTPGQELPIVLMLAETGGRWRTVGATALGFGNTPERAIDRALGPGASLRYKRTQQSEPNTMGRRAIFELRETHWSVESAKSNPNRT